MLINDCTILSLSQMEKLISIVQRIEFFNWNLIFQMVFNFIRYYAESACMPPIELLKRIDFSELPDDDKQKMMIKISTDFEVAREDMKDIHDYLFPNKLNDSTLTTISPVMNQSSDISSEYIVFHVSILDNDSEQLLPKQTVIFDVSRDLLLEELLEKLGGVFNFRNYYCHLYHRDFKDPEAEKYRYYIIYSPENLKKCIKDLEFSKTVRLFIDHRRMQVQKELSLMREKRVLSKFLPF